MNSQIDGNYLEKPLTDVTNIRQIDWDKTTAANKCLFSEVLDDLSISVTS